MDADVIILGGGVLGISLAYHLSSSNLRAILIEREALPASHASGKNAGMLRQLYRHPQLTEWASRSIAMWPENLRRDFFSTTGSIIAPRRLPGHHPELFAERVAALPRGGRRKSAPAIYTATDGLLDSPGYVNALLSLCDKSKIDFYFRESAASIVHTAGRFDVSTQTGKTFSAPLLVNACGAWLNDFSSPQHNLPAIEARAFARHLFVVEGFSESYMPEQDCGFFWDEELGWYMRLWDHDTRLISICDAVAAQPETFSPDPALAERLSTMLLDALPNVAENLRIRRSWHCFRTYTEDQLPIWGEDSRAPGLFWLAAFGGFGMSTSFAAAKDAAEYLQGTRAQNDFTIADFSPNRLIRTDRASTG